MLAPTTRVAVGMPAPDFELVEPSGRRITLADLRGQPAVLAFYPPDWDPARADQLAHFNRLVEQVPGVRAELLGITRDGHWSELDFGSEAVRVPSMTGLDPHGDVAARFGVAGEQAVIVLDEDGVVRWMHTGAAGSIPAASDLVAALTALAPADESRSEASVATAEPVAPCMREHSERFTARGPTRREFIATALGASLALAVTPLLGRAEPLVQRLTSL